MLSQSERQLELTGVSLADADAQQAFVDILSKDVVKPLEILKVRQEDPLYRLSLSNGRLI